LGTIQENKPVDVIRGSYIPDQDLAIIPKWSVQLQHRPDFPSFFKLSDLEIGEPDTKSATSEVSMTGPTTRSPARAGFPAASTTQTVPQKRKRATPESKSSTTSKFLENENLEAVGDTGTSASSAAHNEPSQEASSKLKHIFRSPQPVTTDPKAKSTESQSTSSLATDDFQTFDSPSPIPSPMEGDSGISLASAEKEGSLSKENGVYGISTESIDPVSLTNTFKSKNLFLEERSLSHVDASAHTVSTGQDETLTPSAPSKAPRNLATDPDTLLTSVIPVNGVETKEQSPDAIDTNEAVTAPQRTVAAQDTPALIELPHNLGFLPASTGSASSTVPAGSLAKETKSQPLRETNVTDPIVDGKPVADTAIPTIPAAQVDAVKKPAKKTTYGLTPGRTPYPDFKAPSVEACHIVNDLLTQAHGEVIAPKTIPEPSLTVTGCGEVPSVLDALIRTLLSGATTGRNSARAFNGLVQRFGTLTEGIGKGSVNWDAVRQAPLRDVFKAIERGGLADVKSKNLKALLDQVYEENQERKNRHRAEDSSATDTEKAGMSSDEAKEADEVKEYDIASANDHFLNLQYVHKYSKNKALKALIRYPGIGPKTAACVLLFCLQRPCFAVDTHIFRICKWLGWVPENANEVTAFSHLDFKIPDELKYSLHQLFIKHGKECPRCRAITSPTSADWEKGCIIEELVKRTGRKKVGPSRPHAQAGPAKRISKTTKKTVKRIAKGKRTLAKSDKKAARITRATTQSADNQPDSLQVLLAEVAEQLGETQPPLDQSRASVHSQTSKRKRGNSDAKIPLRRQPSRTSKKTTMAAASKEKSTQKMKKPTSKKTAPKKSGTRKPAKKPQPAPTVGTRTSPRLKLILKQKSGETS
jgi:endonuclease III